MLFLRDTDGDGKADERKVLFTGFKTNDTHAGPSNLRYGLDNWIYAIIGYAGFTGEVGGERLNFRQGFFRFKPDGSKLEFLRSTNNNSWGVGISEEGLLFGSTANGCPSVYMPIPNRYYESVQGHGPGRPGEHGRLEPVLPDHRERPPGRLARRLHRRRRLGPLHRPHVPEALLESHGVRRRADRPPRRRVHAAPGRHGFPLAQRVEPRRQRRRVDFADPRRGRPRRPGLDDRLVQLHRAAQPDAPGVQDRQGRSVRDPPARQDARPHLSHRGEGRQAERAAEALEGRPEGADRGAEERQHVLAAARPAPAGRARQDGRQGRPAHDHRAGSVARRPRPLAGRDPCPVGGERPGRARWGRAVARQRSESGVHASVIVREAERGAGVPAEGRGPAHREARAPEGQREARPARRAPRPGGCGRRRHSLGRRRFGRLRRGGGRRPLAPRRRRFGGSQERVELPAERRHSQVDQRPKSRGPLRRLARRRALRTRCGRSNAGRDPPPAPRSRREGARGHRGRVREGLAEGQGARARRRCREGDRRHVAEARDRLARPVARARLALGAEGAGRLRRAARQGPSRRGGRPRQGRCLAHRRRAAAHRPPQERRAGRPRPDRPRHGEDAARGGERSDRRRLSQRLARGRNGPRRRDGADDAGRASGRRPGAARQDGLDGLARRRDRGGQGADVAAHPLAVSGPRGAPGQVDRRSGQGPAGQGRRPARPGSREGDPGPGPGRPEGRRRLARQGDLQEGMRQVPHALGRGRQGRPRPHRHGGAPEERVDRPHPRPLADRSRGTSSSTPSRPPTAAS